jgi:Uma2 family endonuclease
MAVTPKRMSLAEFLELPEVKPALELRHGMVSQKMPPSGPHSSIQSWFGAQVYVHGELHRLAQAFTEARLILGEDTYVPDVVVYQWDRVPEDESGDLAFFFDTPPDLVVEVLSPGQGVGNQLDRCRELVGHGVRVAVLVDPGRRTIHIIRPDGEIGPLRDGDSVDLSDVFEGFELPASEIFAHARPGRRH